LTPQILSNVDEYEEQMMAGVPSFQSEFKDIKYRSKQMQRVVNKAKKVAPRRSTPVLIEGESGTGKELFARAIHKASTRTGPFEVVNCGAIPKDLVESTLFGHKKGSFTGAISDKKGSFETASGGTLFLDEFGELPKDAQVKLLRALQEKSFTPVGGSREVKVDLRIIAATNVNLRDAVRAGTFREDLYYRVAYAILRLPPLRDREGDLGILINVLLEQANKLNELETGQKPKKLSVGAKNELKRHVWPGNVRELQATITRAVIWSAGSTIDVREVQDAIQPAIGKSQNILGHQLGEDFDIRRVQEDLRRHYLVKALAEADGNKSKAAKLLGLNSQQVITSWMKKAAIKQ